MARTKRPTRRRRTRGEGTLYPRTRTWRTASGEIHSKTIWICAISEGTIAEQGHLRRKRRFFRGATAEAARTARDRYLLEAARPVLPEQTKPTTTFSEYVSRFLQHTKAHARATTCLSYEQVLRLHIVPYIGNLCLADLTSDHVKNMYDRLRLKVSQSMLARVHITLRAVLNMAIEERVISASPLTSIRKGAPRYRRPRVEALDGRQVKRLLQAVKGHRLEALFVLAVTTGMRQGELFAQRWSDVDLSKRTLSVVRSAQEVNGEVNFVEPKTDTSRRRISLSHLAVAALRRRRAIATSEDHDSELVFPSERGYPLRKSNFIRRVWEPICGAAGLGDVRFHGLRHTAASLLLAENIHPKVVSDMLGHASVRITLDTYSHLSPTLQAVAADAFDRLLSSPTRAAV